jgi:hypothetical protein
MKEGIYTFLAVFFATSFCRGLLRTGFFTTGFFAAGFFATVFFAAGFLATGFFTVVVFLTVGFFFTTPTNGRSPHACNGITFRLLFIVDVTISKSQPIMVYTHVHK